MYNLEKAKKPQLYKFHWEIDGYDCRPYKIRSPTFRVSFEVTDWQIELDLSKLKYTDSSIPLRLERISDIGSSSVTFDVEVSVTLGDKRFPVAYNIAYPNISFGENGFWDTLIRISPSLELDWLSSKSLIIDLEMKSPERTHSDALETYWCNDISLRTVEKNLKKLYSDGNFHDLDLKVNGETFKLHKCILNTRWPKLMSTLNLNETSTEVETEAFSGVQHAVLEKLFQFAYCGDWSFMYQLHNLYDAREVFDSVKKHNFYRLNNSISQISSLCECTQMLQSYRTSVQMKFENVTNVVSTRKAMGDFKKIGFMDLSLYVDKGPLGFNWVMFSVVLGELPQENPVTIMCRLYVVGEDNVKTLLADEWFIFDEQNKHFEELSISTPFSQGEVSKRYRMISEPVITWDDLIDEQQNFMQRRKVWNLRSQEPSEEKDIYFEFQLKLADGKYIHNERHAEHIFEYKWDYKIFEDLELIYKDGKFADIEVTSSDGKRCVKAHKAILAARSVILKAILEKQPELKSLKLDIEPDYLHFFIHYIYTGQMQKVPVDKIDHLLSVAGKYDMYCLIEVLENQNLKWKEPLEEGGSCSKKVAT